MKTPKHSAPGSGGTDLAGTDMTATSVGSASTPTGGVPPAVTELAEQLAGQRARDDAVAGDSASSCPAPGGSVGLEKRPAEKTRELREWSYPGNVPTMRPIREWRERGPRRDTFVAIVTERPDDEGTSITNAAEKIVAKLREEHSYNNVEVIEHLSNHDGTDSYSRIDLDTHGRATWTPVTAAELAARLGPEFATSTVLTPLPEGVLTPHQTQAVPPVKWNYGSRTLDSRSVPLPDPEAASAALKNYVFDKEPNPDPSLAAEPAVNATLRGTIAETPQRLADIAVLDRTLEASRIDQPIDVYRGFSNGHFLLPADWRERDLTGLQWTDPAFTSTTSDRDAAECYVGSADDRGFAARLHLPAGTPAISIQDEAGGMDDEGEVVLPRGLNFQVTADRGNQGRYDIRWLDITATAPPGPAADTTWPPQ